METAVILYVVKIAEGAGLHVAGAKRLKGEKGLIPVLAQVTSQLPRLDECRLSSSCTAHGETSRNKRRIGIMSRSCRLSGPPPV